jgi:hypothetical protein
MPPATDDEWPGLSTEDDASGLILTTWDDIRRWQPLPFPLEPPTAAPLMKSPIGSSEASRRGKGAAIGALIGGAAGT